MPTRNERSQQFQLILETPRLIVREMSLADLDFVAAMLAHPEVMQYWPRCYSRDEAEVWIRRQLERYARDGHGRNVRATLREALNTAVTWKLVRDNVAVDVEIPKARKPKVVILTAEQARRFLAAVQGDRLEALYWIALLGLRQGEILALEWERDIDLERRTITINGAVQRIKPATGKGKLEFVPTKTEAGQRTIPLPEVVRDILMQHRARQDVERRRED